MAGLETRRYPATKTRRYLQLFSNASELVEAGHQTGLVLIVRERQVFNRPLRTEANRHTRIQLQCLSGRSDRRNVNEPIFPPSHRPSRTAVRKWMPA
jgi:hypothetical protein